MKNTIAVILGGLTVAFALAVLMPEFVAADTLPGDDWGLMELGGVKKSGDTMTGTLILPAGAGNAASVQLGSTGDGFYSFSDGYIGVTYGASIVWILGATYLGSLGAGAALVPTGVNTTTPSVVINNGSDGNTGLCWADDTPILCGGGLQMFSCAESTTGTCSLGSTTKFVQAAGTIADGDATPSVAGGNLFTTSANTGATEITDLDDPVAGQVLTICGGSDTNSSTITDGGNFALSGNFTAALDDCITLLVQADNDYVELNRVNN